MMPSWANFEDRVRQIANLKWDRQCNPAHLGGVDIDGVVALRDDAVILIEITTRRDLNKVREDVNKLISAKLALTAKGVFSTCYCVIEGSPTNSMKEAGRENHINVLSVDEFQRLFFDFETYRLARQLSAFGSAIDPFTGVKDDTAYVKVMYSQEGSKKEYSLAEIADLLRDGRKIVLLGEYGSGKSRCIKELFQLLSEQSNRSNQYPIAIDLRESWGLKKAGELVRRHFTDLGLEDLQSDAIRASLRNSIVFLLDGFDEIGSQAWSNDDQLLRNIRAKSLEGVRDLIQRSQVGVLVAGREHYFPSNDEMFNALGLKGKSPLVLRAKTEFSEEEIEEYFDQRSITVPIPAWLPRRPLICQTVSNMSEIQAAAVFGVQGGEAAFWDHFLNVICTRDATINAGYDAKTILEVLIYLGRITRTKPQNVGPITLSDAQRAFEMAVGRLPVEEAAVMLQRLPGLGRIGSESIDRQFVDVAILDSLRAKDLLSISTYTPEQMTALAGEAWTNPLDDLGQRVLAQSGSGRETEFIRTCQAAAKLGNQTLAGDYFATLMRGDGPPRDLNGLKISDAYFGTLDFSERGATDFTISNSIIYSLSLPKTDPVQGQIIDAEIGKVIGITSQSALPTWIRSAKVDEFDSAATTAQIRRIGLSAAQEMLVAIIKKTFFQKGSGRKEEALLRGFGSIAPAGLATRVLNLLMRENVLTRFKGDDGWVYAPNRELAGRMRTLLDELRFSSDPLWAAANSL